MDSTPNTGERPAQDLAREANHRIANQLALLTGTIQVQIEELKKGPDQLPRADVRDMLRDAIARIVAIGNLHRRLASTWDDGVALGPFLAACRDDLVSSLAVEDRLTFTESLADGCHVTADEASVLSLVMGEVLVNALKYAHPTGLPVVMSFSCAAAGDGGIVVELGDDGVGLPEGFSEERDGGVGFKLIRSLLAKIGAGLNLQSSALGLVLRISLPPSGGKKSL